MQPIAGIFTSSSKAEAAASQIRSLGLDDNRIVFLAPHTPPEVAESDVPKTDAEPTGIGKALGGTVGGAMGTASGATLGAAAASLMVPGVGPVLAAGILGAAVLGIGGAVTGAALGELAEEGLAEGLPHDELFIYEDALRSGRSVLIAFTDNDETSEAVRDAMTRAGAESIDAVREDWWLGLRDAEDEHYRSQGRDFADDEVSYRRGFEAALNAKFRGRQFVDAASDLEEFFGELGTDEAFRHGYDRGLAYQARFQQQAPAAKQATRATG